MCIFIRKIVHLKYHIDLFYNTVNLVYTRLNSEDILLWWLQFCVPLITISIIHWTAPNALVQKVGEFLHSLLHRFLSLRPGACSLSDSTGTWLPSLNSHTLLREGSPSTGCDCWGTPLNSHTGLPDSPPTTATLSICFRWQGVPLILPCVHHKEQVSMYRVVSSMCNSGNGVVCLILLYASNYTILRSKRNNASAQLWGRSLLVESKKISK